MKRITVDLVMSFNPCYDRETINKLFAGKKWMLPTTVLKLDTVSYGDKLWLLCRSDFLDDKRWRLFACDCAERVLSIFEKEYPDDNRPRKAIETARLFANGEATQKELDAAWDAASDAAWSSARSAAWDAAWSASWDAARAGVWAGDAEQKWQLDRLAMYLRGEK